MDKIQLDQRDRKNLYKEDATNVFALATAPSDINDHDPFVALEEAVEHMRQTGERKAYVVIKIEQ